jgi:phage-related protein
MKLTLFRTQVYLRSLSRLPDGVDMLQVEKEIAQDPIRWPVIPGTGGIRKARFSAGNKGKRGGGRICYFYLMQEESLYLLKAYTKNTQEDLTSDERNVLKQLVRQIKEVKP